MYESGEPGYLRTQQYATGANLSARISLHLRFRAGKVSWHQWMFDHMSIPSAGRILELGCGTGLFWDAIADRIAPDWSVLLSDFSEGMLREARRATDGLACRFHATVVDAQAIPLIDHSFDVVLADHMLYHVPDRDRAFREILRVVAPGGVFYATTIGENHLRQLDEVIGACAPGTPSLRRNTSTFSENTGLRQLRRWFPEVEMELFDDELHVTDAGAIMAYIDSTALHHRLDAADKERISAAVHREIDRRGAFVLDSRNVLFSCPVPSVLSRG